jgi:hypothetical protein
MIDVETETPLTLAEARSHPAFCIRGRHASLEKMHRLVHFGALDLDRNRVRLEAVKLPHALCTSREAIDRFIRRLTDPTIPAPTPKRPQRQINNAIAELESAGFEVGSAD